jgi:hypothetical protein
MKSFITVAALLFGAGIGVAQESHNSQCITSESGDEICVETILTLKPTKPPIPPEPLVNPSANAGAHLPLTYTVADLDGTPRYVATNGSGTACSETAPCASLKDAINKAANGDPIIVKGGTYKNQGNTLNGSSWGTEIYIQKPGIQLLAAPGETVVFDGSVNIFDNAWTKEGTYKWAAYTPRPCGNGFGITFCTESGSDNLNGTDTVYPYNVGKYIDQVWVDGEKLQEVVKKADLNEDRFWVDRTNNRVYLMASTKDAAQNEIAVCNLGDFITVQAADVTLAGFTVQRYCNSQAKASMLDLGPTADRLKLHDVVIDDVTVALFLQGTSSDALEDTQIEHATITDSNWMGVNLVYTDGAVFDGVRMTGMDPWNEFSSSPQSGAIKTSRTIHTVIKNSYFGNNSSHGVWFDQSNWDAKVFNNTFEGSGIAGEGTSFFYEISDALDFYNNVIKAPVGTALKIAGSSNVRILNNTIVGGKDTVGIYADSRSALDCATTGKLASNGASCGGYSSDRWAASWATLPTELNWLTSMDVIQGNIFAYPVSAGLCGATTITCITRLNGPANLKLDEILPNGMVYDCNVYATNAGDLIRHTNPGSTAMVAYNDLVPFTSAMAQASPWPSEQGMEAHGLAGVQYVNPDGTPTAALTALHAASPCSFPTDAVMNATIPAGSKHYGVLY